MRAFIPRRSFLKGAGVAIALPMLEAMTPVGRAATQSDRPVKRFVCLSSNYGIYRKAFFPKADQVGVDYEMPETLKPLERHRKDFTVFSNLDHGKHNRSPGCARVAQRRPTSSRRALPRRKHQRRPEDRRVRRCGNAIPVDDRSRQRVELCQLYANRRASSGDRCPWHVPRVVPRRFTRQEATAVERLKRRNSILDVVLDKAKAVHKDLSARDQRKFAEYLDAVRTLEKKIEQQQPWLDKPKPKTDHPEPPQGKGTEADLRAMVRVDRAGHSNRFDASDHVVIGFVNGDFGLSGGYHGFSHHGERPSHIAALKLIENNKMRQMAHLLDLLKAQEDTINGGTLRDHTTVMFGCGMATGPHSTKNLPLLVAGGGFEHGKHKCYPDDESQRIPAANLLLSILQNHGLEIDRFGSSNGSLPGLKWS